MRAHGTFPRGFGRGAGLLGICLLIAATAAAEEIRLIPLFRHGTISDGVGSANLVAYDLDGDKRAELISCSLDAPFAVSARGETYVTTWHGPASSCNGVTAGDRNLDGGADIIVAGNLSLDLYDPRSLGGPAVRVMLPAGAAANDVALGNVDDDAAPEIVVVTNNATLVYDGATLELQWTAANYGGWSVRIGDVDGDARREIVVSGGFVLDGAAEVHKWGYAGGFGDFDLGNMDGDARDEIVFSGSFAHSFTILDGDTFDETTFEAAWFDTIAVGDANGDGAAEVITGNNQWGSIRGLSPVNGGQLWSIGNPEHGTMGVGTADLDADGVNEVFWGAGGSSSGDDALFVGHASNPQYVWRCVDLDGSYFVAAGDLDGDGRPEYVVATSSSGSGYDAGILEVFDAATGQSEGRLPFTNWAADVHALAIGQLDNDAALEVAALAGGTLHTWDGITRLAEFTSNGGSYGLMTIANLDGDAVEEIVVSTLGYIVVLNGASNIIQKSVPVNGIRDFALADLNGAGARELVVGTTDGLTVFDTVSWEVLGSHAVSNIASIAATAAGGGTVAVSYSSYYFSSPLELFKGVTLTPAYKCSIPLNAKMAFADIGEGETRLLTSTTDGLRVYPLTADACPARVATFATNLVQRLAVLDVTGDGRDEILINSHYGATVALLGLSSELRGDADGDEIVTGDDVDKVADFLFGTEPGLSPAADANADGRIGIEDVFTLIDHEFAGGAPLQP